MQGDGVDDLVERVRTERRLRGLSVRAASGLAAGLITNQTWGSWENRGGPPSEKVRKGIAAAFEWPMDWPENPPAVDLSPFGDDPRSIRRLLLAVGMATEALLKDAVDDGEEDLAELLDELHLALRAVQ